MLRKINKKIIYGACGFFVLLVLMILGGNKPLLCIVAGAFGGVMGYFAEDIVKRRKVARLRRSYDMQIPDLLVDVAMLMESGLNVWEAICRSCATGDKKKPLYAALDKAVKSVEKGICSDYCVALENMAQECRCTSVTNFVSLVVQNSRKGNDMIIQVLVNSASFYRSERKNTATKLAGEATTLMLLPSAAVLVAMILLMVAPAVIQMIGGL